MSTRTGAAFRLMRLGPYGSETPAVQDATGAVYALDGLTADIDGDFLAAGGIATTAAALRAGSLPQLPGWDRLRRGAPIARPMAVLCVGMNYAAHAAESGAAPPESVVVFLKHPNTVIGPDDDVLLPPGAEKLDWEVELAVVIGRRARYLRSPRQSPDHIAGYAIANDISERSYQLEQSGGQWSKGKCCETFNPVGPYLVPRAQVDAGSLRLRSWVNGEPRQDSTTADLIFDVYHLVWHLSQFMVLEPGDVINTGTPPGVALSGRFPYLRDGDSITVEIDGLGRQSQRVRAATIVAGSGAAISR